MNRRKFISTSTGASLAFLGLKNYLLADTNSRVIDPYGPLIPDPNGLLDLPKDFSYQVLSKGGEIMTDGFRLPGRPDGMAAFPGKDGRVILVRNHELQKAWSHMGPFHPGKPLTQHTRQQSYDPGTGSSTSPHIGGTTNLVYNPKTQKVEKQFLSLTGTDRNCAGGAMPWGTWITCEEPKDRTDTRAQKHGYCFEVRATDDGKLQKATPLKALGRFCHEAVALDPRTGTLYLTEDLSDGLLYRFLPEQKNDFTKGTLQALAIKGSPSANLTNFHPKSRGIAEGQSLPAEWITLDNVEAPKDDLRHRGHKVGAAKFARGEGIVYSDGQIYICCTNGGVTRQGQIMKLTPATTKGVDDQLELFLEPQASDLLTNCDNICVSPKGDLIICEDLVAKHANKKPHLRGITPDGKIYTIARNAKDRSEFAGSCFSPDGNILFVNMQILDLTLAIHFPHKAFR